MNDVFLNKLRQINISVNAEKTKSRTAEIWKNANKKNKQKLITFTGHGMYTTISKITKNGRITAKMTILLSRYLNANPFYLIGQSEKNKNYNDDLLKEFLIRLGYKNLWLEYEKHSNAGDTDIENEDDESETDESEITDAAPETTATEDEEKHDINDIHEIEENFDNYIKEALQETADICNKEIVHEISLDSPNNADETADIPEEILNIMNELTEEEIITLLKAMLIRAKVNNSNSRQIADQIKLKLLLD